MIVLDSERAVAHISPTDGGRVASLVVDGRELLVERHHGSVGGNPLSWGSYVMVPFAGRIGGGTFAFEGRTVSLPTNLGPHAHAGTAFAEPWEVQADGSLLFAFAEPWPFAGRCRQRFALDEHRLVCTIEVEVDEPQPVSVGWHPWFARPVELLFDAARMYERSADHLPTGRLVQPAERPWDDCFCELRHDPILRFADGPTLTISSSCATWVVFDEPSHAICVEPISDPPDAVHLDPRVVRPGTTFVETMTWSW